MAQEAGVPPQGSLCISTDSLELPTSPWPMCASCDVTLRVSMLRLMYTDQGANAAEADADMAAGYIAGRSSCTTFSLPTFPMAMYKLTST